MFKSLLYCFFLLQVFLGHAQTVKPQTSSDILLSLKKFGNVSSVLYIAAHPDDENTRLLAYLSNERCVRTGYLSLTRGDGGQNLIGNEQGIELGMIRTQELLAARRIDGAEQFFSRAYDFGFCKSPEEALSVWGHDKILSDVVWVIRKFRPDVIITRFPTTGEGGHGHHTASAILAVEAVEAAADSKKFPEQFSFGVKPWKVQRLFWNTFNFGSVNTQKEDQLKIDVGGFNFLMGQSYGEIAAKSRSQHKSQGFGVSAQRGAVTEYFSQLYGNKAKTDLLEDIAQGWNRYGLKVVDEEVRKLIKNFRPDHPESIVSPVLKMRKEIVASKIDSGFKQFKLLQLDQLLASASGIYLESVTGKQIFSVGDTVIINLLVNVPFNTGLKKVNVEIAGQKVQLNDFLTNQPAQKNIRIVADGSLITQPYWLKQPMEAGSFSISDQKEIGLAEEPALAAFYELEWSDGSKTHLTGSVLYKHTDPVKGELYQPLAFTYPLTAKLEPAIALFSQSQPKRPVQVQLTHQGGDLKNSIHLELGSGKLEFHPDKSFIASAGARKSIALELTQSAHADVSHVPLIADNDTLKDLHAIRYDHIPDLFYHSTAEIKSFNTELVISGKRVGYINGAGDKVMDGLKQMGYEVTLLGEEDIRNEDLSAYDAIVTGVRAYNVNSWMPDVYPVLMRYVSEGGVLLVQYNTNNNLGPLNGKIGPYPFTISRNRITDENAKVEFLNTQSSLLNYPNKISDEDFGNWIQERSIYHAENIDEHYEKLFSMKDPGEKPNDGSLISATYGKGRFIYTGLVFYRELPAGVPGAYRLLANLLAKPQR
jgi:LmbE family N-acetylglucosaminyl deacetylase